MGGFEVLNFREHKGSKYLCLFASERKSSIDGNRLTPSYFFSSVSSAQAGGWWSAACVHNLLSITTHGGIVDSWEGSLWSGKGRCKYPRANILLFIWHLPQPYMFTKEVKSYCHSSQQLWLTAKYINNIPEYSLKQSDYNWADHRQ